MSEDPLLMLVCRFCQRTYTVFAHQFDWWLRSFCSHDCARKHYSTPGQRGIACSQCGETIFAQSPSMDRYKGEFCSVECAKQYHGLSGGELCR